MPTSSLYDRLVALPAPDPGIDASVPPEIIAFNVSVTRRLRSWKQSTLADMAGISLSTLERIERGERVLPEALDRIGAAFGFEPGYYTAARRPLTPEELAQPENNPYPHIAIVKVSPLDNQAKLRSLARCDLVVHAPLGGHLESSTLVSGLFELIETLAFRLAAGPLLTRSSVGGLRELYHLIFSHLDEMRREGLGVVFGVEPDTSSEAPRRVGIVGIAHRDADPAVRARKILILDRRHFSGADDQGSQAS